MSKRYVLFLAHGEFSVTDVKNLSKLLESRYGKTTVITVQGNPLAVIVKTTNSVAPLLREKSEDLRIGDRRLTAVLTSGCIGKLKSTACESSETRHA